MDQKSYCNRGRSEGNIHVITILLVSTLKSGRLQVVESTVSGKVLCSLEAWGKRLREGNTTPSKEPDRGDQLPVREKRKKRLREAELLRHFSKNKKQRNNGRKGLAKQLPTMI